MSKSTVREWFDSVKQKARSWFTQVTTSAPQKPSGPDQGHITEGSLFALGLVLLSSLIIGIISFSRPTSRAVSNDLQYQHLAIFSYLASAPQSVYDSNAIKSGDPIFPLLTCAVDVNLQYTLIAQDAANITGTYQLTAIIREQISGWQRALPLQEETAFSGSTFGTTASLDLCKFEALTQSMEQETEFHPGAYTLVVMPNVKVNGSVSGRTLDATFNSGLKFHYDRVHFYLAQDTETGSPLSVTETGSIKEVRNEANTVVFLGSQIPVTVLRWMAVIGLVVSLAGFVFLGLKLQTLATTDQAQFFRVRHDALMVDVNNTDLLNSGHIVEVKSIEALAKLAERFNAMILHVEQDGSHQYLVQAGGTTYQFRLKADRTGTTVPANEPTEHGDEA